MVSQGVCEWQLGRRHSRGSFRRLAKDEEITEVKAVAQMTRPVNLDVGKELLQVIPECHGLKIVCPWQNSC